MKPQALPANWREVTTQIVERGHRFDRFLPKILLDSPLSRFGFWCGTAFGFLWGSLWSTGSVQRRNGLWVFTGMPNWTFGRGGVCVGGCFLTRDPHPDDRVLRHEAIHAEQWRRYGLLMPVLYLIAGRNPLQNRFEIEADLQDGNYVSRSLT